MPGDGAAVRLRGWRASAGAGREGPHRTRRGRTPMAARSLWGPAVTRRLHSSASELMTDAFSRRHSYLRISLTEKCNLRCVYCMPAHGVSLTPREHLMTLEERKRAISLFCDLGVNKLRFTGGEPTVSNQLLPLIAHSRQYVDTVAITSNGLMLSKEHLRNLTVAGLTSVNISLDTMSEQKFGTITRRDGKLVNKVLAAIYGAVAAGLPVKVNCVVMRGWNDDEIARFVEMTTSMPIDVRFIEIMPFDGNEWNPKQFVSYREIIDRLQKEQGIEMVREPRADPSDTTKWYRASPSSAGRVGFISSMSSNFCGGCNRLRLTADGKLKVCLFGKEETSLLELMRSGSTDDDVAKAVGAALQRKHRTLGGHRSAEELALDTSRPMILIGG